jgi:hypothetical protein
MSAADCTSRCATSRAAKARRGGKPQQQLVGRTFGRLTVLEQAEKPRTAHRAGLFWLCRCECGTETIKFGCHLTSGGSTSCGCYRREKAATLAALRRRGTGARVPIHVVHTSTAIAVRPPLSPQNSGRPAYPGRPAFPAAA